MATSRTTTSDPIAIVGLACRYPGSPNADAFWSLLCAKSDAITDIPAERFDARALGLNAPRGGFLDHVEGFDAAFFGINPREASLMDPQQRIALEVAHDALEDAGYPPAMLHDQAVGVYVGVCSDDYAAMQARRDAVQDLTALVGTQRSAMAGRIAYHLQLRGPSMVVDTDRSSSLVALHLAAHALRQGDCTFAIAGGVSLILRGTTSVALNEAMMLAPDGRCKFGDADANGIVRSEGVGFVALQRLSDARAQGNQVYAIVRGSAVNSDAGRSHDLFAPSVAAQEDLLRRAHHNARIQARDLTYIEAHGTGTPVGDPIELSAIAKVLSTHQGKHTCTVGSVKGHIGHTEAAAGIAGVIKVCLMMRHRILVESLNIRRPTTAIDFKAARLELARKQQAWPRGRKLLAGVSAFGLTGTNAHVVLEGLSDREVKGAKSAARRSSAAYLTTLSGRSAVALRQLAERYADAANRDTFGSEHTLADIAYTATQRHRAHAHRLSIVSRTKQEMGTQLTTYLQDGEAPGVAEHVSLESVEKKIAFVFSGHGAHWRGMGVRLFANEEVFRESIETCHAAFARINGWRFIDVFKSTKAKGAWDKISFVQPVHTVLQIALARLWMSWGVKPHAVVGTSIGEVPAAYVAGGITLDDAMRLCCVRSELLQRSMGATALLLLNTDAQHAQEIARQHGKGVAVAVVNGPSSTALAGVMSEVRKVHKAAEKLGLLAKVIEAPASHTMHMTEYLPELLERLGNFKRSKAVCDFYSTVTAKVRVGGELRAPYWSRNLREQVRFWPTLQAMLADGYNVFVELSAHPVLLSSLLEGVQGHTKPAVAVASLRRNEDEHDALLQNVGALHASGVAMDLRRFYPERVHVTPSLGYPWEGRDVEALRLTPETPVHHASARLTPLMQASTGPRQNSDSANATLFEQAARASSIDARREVIVAFLRGRVRQLTGRANDADVPQDKGFADLGLTSLMNVQLRTSLGKQWGQTLPASFLFNHPSIDAVTAYLQKDARLAEANATSVPPAAVSAPPDASTGTQPAASEPAPRVDARTAPPSNIPPVAVIGMACRFPGADSPEALWELLRTGGEAISDIPANRWNADQFYSERPGLAGTMVVRRGGFISDVDCFDAEFFGISPREAQEMDPQQRILMHVVWEALEDAGIAPHRLNGSPAGVFVGMSNNNDYTSLKDLHHRPNRVEAHHSTGQAMSIAAGRLAYFLGAQGPALTVDTACSSSLVALSLAQQSLARGEIDVAIVAAVNLILSPEMHLAYSRAGMLAPDGRCKTFDKHANGYVRSEGCGALILRRLADVKPNERTYGRIVGAAVNQDGRSVGLTAPNGLAQQAVVRRALAQARLAPVDIQYVEAHGTGTPLGDPVEVEALGEVLAHGRDPQQPFGLGSIKTNVGHLEAAAGLAGVMKVLLAFQNDVLPPHRNFEALNPDIDLERARARILTQLTSWDAAPGKRFAGVSAFGISGTNAHVILGDTPSPTRTRERAAMTQHVLPLSAKTPEALRALVNAYLIHLQTTKADIADICYAAATSRTHFANRLALVAPTKEAMVSKARAAMDAPTGPQAMTGTDTIALLARAYEVGEDVDWALIYPADQHIIVALPHYPFSLRRYWVDYANESAGSNVITAAGKISIAAESQTSSVMTDPMLEEVNRLLSEVEQRYSRADIEKLLSQI